MKIEEEEEEGIIENIIKIKRKEIKKRVLNFT